MALRKLVDRLHQPAYTGENRCLPCTMLNVAIGAISAGAITVLLRSRVDTLPSIGAGAVVFAAAVALIAVRGYLVPGTPRLTNALLPDRVRNRLHDRPAGIDDEADLDLALKGVGATTPDTQSADGEATGSIDRPARDADDR